MHDICCNYGEQALPTMAITEGRAFFVCEDRFNAKNGVNVGYALT